MLFQSIPFITADHSYFTSIALTKCSDSFRKKVVKKLRIVAHNVFEANVKVCFVGLFVGGRI